MSSKNKTNAPGDLDAVRAFGSLEVSEKEHRRGEDIERRQQIIRFLTSAAAGDRSLENIVKDPERLDWLVGLVIKQPDGSESFVGTTMQQSVNRDRLSVLGIEKRIADTLEKAVASADSYIADRKSASIALARARSDAHASGSNLLEGKQFTDLQLTLDSSLDRSEILAKQSACANAARMVIEASSIGQSESGLLKKLSVIDPYLGASHRIELANALGSDHAVDARKKDAVLVILKQAFSFKIFDAQGLETMQSSIKSEMDAIGAQKKLNIIPRTAERREFNNRFGGSDAETIINFSIVGNKLDFAVLEAQLKALKISVDLEELKKNAGLHADGTMPASWNKTNFVTYLSTHGLSNPVGISLSEIHSKVDHEKPWDEQVKEYTSELSKISGAAAGIWFDWIKSLPKNVVPQPQDKELLTLQNRESALGEALSSIETLAAWEKKSIASMDRVFSDLESLQSDIDANTLTINAAALPSEKAAQSKLLLATAKSVLLDLETGTDFSLQQNPRIRQTAFYLAMTRGIDDAKEFLRSPEGYSVQHSDLADQVIAYNGRVSVAERTSGRDILQPMRSKLGIELSPHALDLLLHSRDANGEPYAIDDLVTKLKTDPKRVCELLSLILVENSESGIQGGKEALLHAYLTKEDHPLVTSAEAGSYVVSIHHRLSKLVDDQNVVTKQNSRSDQPDDILNAFRNAKDTLTEMLKSDDPAEKILAGALVAGGIYAVYKMWQAGGMWRTMLVGIPAFAGLDIAMKRATGKSIRDRFNLHYLSEEDRNSSLEQFVRQGSTVEGYDVLATDAGRESVRQLMNPKEPIPVADLLAWQDCVINNGRQDFALGAPPSLKPNRVVEKIGLASARNTSTAELKKEAYATMFKAFESLCIQVAERQTLGGRTPEQKAALGAAFIRKRYVEFSDAAGSAMECSGKIYTMQDVLSREMPTPATQEALAALTIPELIGAKLGLSKDAIVRMGTGAFGAVQLKVEDAYARAPKAAEYIKDTAVESFDSFMTWAKPTGYKLTQEVKDDLLATYNLIYGTCAGLGLTIKKNGPKGVEWVFDKTVAGGRFTRDKAVDLWNELHSHQVSGNIIEGFEAMIQLVFGESIKNINIAKLATVESLKKDIVQKLQKSCEPGKIPFGTLVNGWLVNLGIAEKDGADAIREKAGVTPAEKMLKVELLKREMFCRLAAERIEAIQAMAPNEKFSVKRLDVAWPEDMDADLKLSDGMSDAGQEINAYLRSRYNSAEILSLIGQERVIPAGFMKDYAEKYADSYDGKAVGIANVMIGWITRDTASEYITHDMAVYSKSLLAEAETLRKNGTLSEKDHENYKHYIDTLLLNVLLESTLSEPGSEPSDLTLKVSQAKQYLANLKNNRGDTPEIKNVSEQLKKIDFAVKDHEIPQQLEELLADPSKKWFLAGQDAPQSAKKAVSLSGEKKEVIIPRASDSKINEALTYDMKDIDDQQKVLKVIPTARERQPELRKKFDDRMSEARKLKYADDASKTELQNYLLGVSDGHVREIEKQIITGIPNAKALQELQQRKNKIPEAHRIERARMQHLIDRAVFDLLTREGSVVEEIAAVADPTKLADQPKYAEWKQELGRLYDAASSETAPLLRDTVSIAMEYLFTQGDYKNATIDAYNAYLKDMGLDPISKEFPDPTFWEWVMKKAWSDDYVAAQRFDKQSKNPSLVIHSVRKNLLKGQLEQ